MNTNKFVLHITILASCLAGSSAMAACADKRITDAFSLATGRAPSTAECNANLYAGGNFSNTVELVPLVKASLVCSDPWVAQAYYKLNLKLNGHDPTLLENGRPSSTQGQCNYSIYGSWTNFDGLLQNVRNYFSPTSKPPTAAMVSASITGPQTLASGRPVTVTWSYTGTPTSCGSGVNLEINGGPIKGYTIARIPSLTSKSAAFTMGDWRASLNGNTQVSMQLVDNCTGKPISTGYSATLTVPAKGPQVSIPGKGLVTINPLKFIDYAGNLLDAAGAIAAVGYHLDLSGALISPSGGRMITSDGAGIIAKDASVVAQGGGNVVGHGGASFTIATALDRSIRGLSSDGYLVDSWGIRALSVKVVNGVILDQNKGWPVVAQGGGNLISEGGAGLKAVTVDAKSLQEVLVGRLSVSNILNPGNINPSVLVSTNGGNIRSIQSVGAFSINQFSPASTTWANNTGLQVNWGYRGTPPSNEMVEVQFVVGGKAYKGCAATSISSNRCQIPPTNFNALMKSSTAGALNLLDSATKKVLSSTSVTMKVP